MITAANLELGPANVYLGAKPVASLDTAMTGTDNDIRLVAQTPGAGGNSITLTLVDPATASHALEVSVVTTAITVTLATSAVPAITSTAQQVVDAINAHAGASSLVKAMLKSGDDGTGVVTALTSTPLAGGSDTVTMVDVGALGEDLQVTIGTEATVLTAAQTGTVPQDKVISGGSFKVAVPFKEITLANLQKAIPNAMLFDDGGATPKQRLEFISRTGLSMRSLATKMEIRKIVGGVESTATKDILVLASVSPVDGEVQIPFNPTTQRVVVGNFECWPDARGKFGSYGDQDF